ncbi:hypothetical protein RF11_08674 [Thelohanellus kitauei]|uniref:Uncharacterized protein n=1 Tax=Thelohanellus kitauei TaxID=669202 RepID=A0A0C2N7E9_THEKT|nr:hypothetical protein RF11_08674 [Thelohanellus kitauei]
MEILKYPLSSAIQLEARIKTQKNRACRTIRPHSTYLFSDEGAKLEKSLIFESLHFSSVKDHPINSMAQSISSIVVHGRMKFFSNPPFFTVLAGVWPVTPIVFSPLRREFKRLEPCNL